LEKAGDPERVTGMKTLRVLFFVFVTTVGIATAQQGNVTPKPKVRPEVWMRIQEKGSATVGVQLSGQWELDADLSREAALAQRKAIAAAQESLIVELAETEYKLVNKSTIGPFISLQIGPAALAVLEGSSRVKDVYLEEEVLIFH
jgi:hypothetical protein